MVSGWVAVAAAVNLAIFLLQFDFNSCASSSLFPAVGTVNGSVTLSPLNTLPFTEIIWKKGKNKVIEWDSDGVRSYPPFDARIQLNNVSGDLHISYLTSWDEGEYEVEMHPSKSMKYYLTVFDPLPSPILQCQLVNESIEVQCQVPESYSRHRGQLNYSWHCRLPQCDENTTPVLRLNQNDNLSEQVHCSVANPESRKASSADLSTCVPHYNSRNRDLLILSLTIAVCMCMFVMCYWKCGRRTEATVSS